MVLRKYKIDYSIYHIWAIFTIYEYWWVNKIKIIHRTIYSWKAVFSFEKQMLASPKNTASVLQKSQEFEWMNVEKHGMGMLSESPRIQGSSNL